MFSLASIATMAACIFMFGLFYVIVSNFTSMVKDAEEGVAVTVFFDEGISDEQIQQIGDQIRSRAEVAKCDYLSADEAWENFKTQKKKAKNTNHPKAFAFRCFGSGILLFDPEPDKRC